MNQIIEQLNRNKAVFQDLLTNNTEEQVLWKQAPEKWCLLEIVCHLYDEERYDFRFRTQWVLETPNQSPPPIDPVGWVLAHHYIKQDYSKMLNTFLMERDQSLIWLQSLKNVNWDHTFEHPKLGTLSAKHFLTNWLAHDYLHMKQILKLKYDFLKHQSGENLDYAGVWP
ncbi:DinB family protein [Flavobacteriaceae bacterium LMO-SS05]